MLLPVILAVLRIKWRARRFPNYKIGMRPYFEPAEVHAALSCKPLIPV